LREDYAASRMELTEVTERRDAAAAHVDVLEEQLKKLQAEFSASEVRCWQAKKDTANALEAYGKEAADISAKAAKQLEQKTAELTATETERDALAARLDVLEKEAAELGAALAAAEQSAREVGGSAEDAGAERDQLRMRLDEMQAELSQAYADATAAAVTADRAAQEAAAAAAAHAAAAAAEMEALQREAAAEMAQGAGESVEALQVLVKERDELMARIAAMERELAEVCPHPLAHIPPHALWHPHALYALCIRASLLIICTCCCSFGRRRTT
jgi:chromosome segregation ATPase